MKKTILIAIVLAFATNAQVLKADFTFGTPTNLGPPINSLFQDGGVSLSADGLTLFFESDRPDHESWDLFMAYRETLAANWSEPVNLGPAVNRSDRRERDACISSDGLALYFSRGSDSEGIDFDLYVTIRETTDGEWCTAVSLGETVNSPGKDGYPCISDDGLSLYFTSNRAGGEGRQDLYVTTRLTKNDAWSVPVNLGPTVNSPVDDFGPSLTSDGLSLIFVSTRPGKFSKWADLWMTKRRSTSDLWREPINLGPTINKENTDDVSYVDISPDGTTLFLTCWQRPGNYGCHDIWEVPIIPIVDFNNDGIVDSVDMCIMLDYWCEDCPLCDIGPTPLGDGVVEVQDLIVLAEHLFEEIPPAQ
jgi:Tol biopolymer transport system component